MCYHWNDFSKKALTLESFKWQFDLFPLLNERSSEMFFVEREPGVQWSKSRPQLPCGLHVALLVDAHEELEGARNIVSLGVISLAFAILLASDLYEYGSQVVYVNANDISRFEFPINLVDFNALLQNLGCGINLWEWGLIILKIRGRTRRLSASLSFILHYYHLV